MLFVPRDNTTSGREIKIICFGDKVRGTQPFRLALYLYIWFVFCVNIHNQIEFVTLICILLWDGRTNGQTDERTSRNISIDTPDWLSNISRQAVIFIDRQKTNYTYVAPSFRR